MKIILAVPPMVQDVRFRATLFSAPMENLGLESILASCKAAGLTDVECVSCPIEGWSAEEAAHFLIERKPDLVGITINYEQTDWMGGCELATKLRAHGYSGFLVAGGIAATELSADLMCMFDLVIAGEGEVIFPRVAAALSAGGSTSNLPGVISQMGVGPAAEFPDVSMLPLPERVLLEKCGWYHSSAGVPIETSRGCWGHCNFCMVPKFHGRRWRPKPIARVVEEMKQIHDQYGIGVFEFVDDNFFGPRGSGHSRAFELASGIRQANLSVRFGLSCRADMVDRDTILALKEVGLVRLYVGLESGSQSMLDRFGKGLKVEDNRRAVETIASTGVPANCCFIMFDPWTTLSEYRETLRFIRETGAYRLGMRPYNLLNSLLVVKGTTYYEWLKDSTLLVPYGKMLWKTSYVHPETRVLHDAVSRLDQFISPVDLRYRNLFSQCTKVDDWLRHHMSATIQSIEGLDASSLVAYTKWYDRLPGLILRLLEAATDMVEYLGSSYTNDSSDVTHLALVKLFNREYEEHFSSPMPFEAFTKVEETLAAPSLRIALRGDKTVVVPNPSHGVA